MIKTGQDLRIVLFFICYYNYKYVLTNYASGFIIINVIATKKGGT